MTFQSCFVSTIVQFLAMASSSALSNLPTSDAIVGVFAFAVGVMHKSDKVRAPTWHRERQDPAYSSVETIPQTKYDVGSQGAPTAVWDAT
jgi:hypothetical protein